MDMFPLSQVVRRFLQGLRQETTSRFHTVPVDIIFECLGPYLNPWEYLSADQIPKWQLVGPADITETPLKTITCYGKGDFHRPIDLTTYSSSRGNIFGFWSPYIHRGFHTIVIQAVMDDNWLVLLVFRDKNCHDPVLTGHPYLEFWRLADKPTYHSRILLDKTVHYHLLLRMNKLYLFQSGDRLHILDLTDDQLAERRPYLPVEEGISCPLSCPYLAVDPRSGCLILGDQRLAQYHLGLYNPVDQSIKRIDIDQCLPLAGGSNRKLFIRRGLYYLQWSTDLYVLTFNN